MGEPGQVILIAGVPGGTKGRVGDRATEYISNMKKISNNDSQQQNYIELILNEADDFLQKGKYDKAVEIVKKLLLSQDKKILDILKLLFHPNRRLDLKVKALAIWGEAMLLSGNYPRAYDRLKAAVDATFLYKIEEVDRNQPGLSCRVFLKYAQALAQMVRFEDGKGNDQKKINEEKLKLYNTSLKYIKLAMENPHFKSSTWFFAEAHQIKADVLLGIGWTKKKLGEKKEVWKKYLEAALAEYIVAQKLCDKPTATKYDKKQRKTILDETINGSSTRSGLKRDLYYIDHPYVPPAQDRGSSTDYEGGSIIKWKRINNPKTDY